MLIERGTLWSRMKETTAAALASGALLPIPTTYSFVEEQGVRYFVRILEGLKRKDEARKEQDNASGAGKTANPFLPPEPALTAGDLTDTHIAVLNKFNVVEHHLLIVTRQYEDQDSLLTRGDFEALWLGITEYDSLGFYNGGREAGASQQHKHLQLVPLPLAPEGPALPLEPLFADAGPKEGLSEVPAFPFLHSFARFDRGLGAAPSAAAGETHRLYGEMLKQLGMIGSGSSSVRSRPYCLLVTRGWMLLVPRSREFFGDISLNSLAFAGSFFVRSRDQLERIRSQGMMKALSAVALERPRR